MIYDKYKDIIDDIFRHTRKKDSSKFNDFSRKAINGIKNGIDTIKNNVPKI
ncbi:MAG: hypothetical protein ACLFUH_05920 [Bacteroidales bacterium]